MADISDAAICDLTPEVIRHSVLALEINVLRGMDAFISADVRQCIAATQAGLRVVQV